MARIESGYTVETENTDKQGGGGGILPHMYAVIQAESIGLPATKDNKGTQAEITFEVIEPIELKGRKFWEYWTIVHPDEYQHGQYKYGKPRFDRLVRATGTDKEEFERNPDTDDLVFKSFVAEIGIEIGSPNPNGGFYKDKNKIEKFFYEDANAKEPIPELGIIGDGTQGKKRNEAGAPAAANDNKPAARAPANDNKAAAPAAGGARRPWGQK
jgi:hypothetical protein